MYRPPPPAWTVSVFVSVITLVPKTLLVKVTILYICATTSEGGRCCDL